MKTVGEFKKAGLVFVIGDVVDDDGNNDGSKMKPLPYWMVEHCNTGRYNYYHAKVESFAWRENTGVKPEFSGLVDVEFSDSKALTNCKARVLNWSGSDIVPSVIKWRPSLNQHQNWPDNSRMDIIGQNGNDGLHYDNTAQQVESLAVKQPSEKMKFALDEVDEISAKVINDKPIFTQAMADEYIPQSGCECEIMLYGHWQKCFIVGLSKKGNPVIEIGAHCVESVGRKYRAIDTRTDREKAIDEMLELDLWATDREFLEAAYDAGYRKC